MGHLYHGYVSHNQRVIFFCVCVCTPQDGLKHWPSLQVDADLSTAKLWHCEQTECPRV